MKTWPYKVNFQTLFTVLSFMLHFKFSIIFFILVVYSYKTKFNLQSLLSPILKPYGFVVV
jgi:hypothetical protein